MAADSPVDEENWSLCYLDRSQVKIPHVPCVTFLNGEIVEWKGAKQAVTSPLLDPSKGLERAHLGEVPQMQPSDSLAALEGAVRAWDSGKGMWPLAEPSYRASCVWQFAQELRQLQAEVAHLLSLEIAKTVADAANEVKRTIAYIEDTVVQYASLQNGSLIGADGGFINQIRRQPVGVCLVSGPMNYPHNESLTLVIPALIVGNTAVMKLPRFGALSHVPLFAAWQKCFPPGVINVISGSGRETMPPIIATGQVDILAFIGTSPAASALFKAHPAPHRFRACLGLEAKNPAIVLADADLELAVSEVLLGALSFNGQRCTAIKVVFAQRSIAALFAAKLAERVDQLKLSSPWDPEAKITPLAEPGKPEYLAELVADALSKGAHLVTKKGNRYSGTAYRPAVLFPVSPACRVFHEEQFGPLVPVCEFDRIEEVYEHIAASPYGQQAALFTANPAAAGHILDVLVNQVARVNLNCQCQRSPDTLPFTGRKNSALLTLSTFDALRVFSIRCLVAAKGTKKNEDLVNEILQSRTSQFLKLTHLFPPRSSL